MKIIETIIFMFALLMSIDIILQVISLILCEANIRMNFEVIKSKNRIMELQKRIQFGAWVVSFIWSILYYLTF